MKIHNQLCRAVFAGALLLLFLSIGGCASSKTLPDGKQSAVSDPLEPVNRITFAFNQKVDRYFYRPVARGYSYMLPPVWRRGIENFFDNLGMPATVVHDVLQLKLTAAARDTGRFVVNSTVGLLGFIDVAQHWGMPDHSEDFGQTLGRWGIPAGPYLVLPFLPPTNFRDFGGFVSDFGFLEDELRDVDLVYLANGCDEDINARAGTHTRSGKERNLSEPPMGEDQNCALRWEDGAALQGLDAINSRAERLRLDKVLELQTDQYIFVRELLMRARSNAVKNGGGDDDDDDDELLDELFDES